MELLFKKINTLNKEAEVLVARKSEIEREQQQIDIRLTQIVGAISELQQLKNEIEQSTESTANETRNDRESQISKLTGKADEDKSSS